MRGSVYQYYQSEIKANTTECETMDNIYNHDFKQAKKLYKSVGVLFKCEDEFNDAKERHIEQIT